MPSPILGRHEDKAAIVTGAGQGIGRGVAKRFAQQGAPVVVAEFNRSNAEEAANKLSALDVEGLAYAINFVGEVERIPWKIADVVTHFGRIDILVNNAGVNKTQFMLNVKPEDLAAAISFLCSSNAECITGQPLTADGGVEMN